MRSMISGVAEDACEQHVLLVRLVILSVSCPICGFPDWESLPPPAPKQLEAVFSNIFWASNNRFAPSCHKLIENSFSRKQKHRDSTIFHRFYIKFCKFCRICMYLY